MIPIGLSIAALLAVAAVVFVESDQTQRVSSDARLVGAAEQVVSATMELRANTGISLVIASAEAARLDVEETSRQAVTATRGSVEDLEASVNRLRSLLLTEASERMEHLATQALSAADATLDEIEAGELDIADDLARSTLLPSLADLEASARELSDEAALAIEVEGTAAGKAARVASLAVALILPAVAVLLVRSVVRRRAERSILENALEAERKSSAARDDLIASLSHQIRTPLSGIYGFAEALHTLSGSGSLDQEFAREASEAIFAEAFELRRLVDDLLVMARSVSGHLEPGSGPVDVTRSVEAASEPFQQWGNRIEVDIEPAHVLADHLRLQHALRNLIHNAVCHGRAPVLVTGRLVEQNYRLAVRDAGEGLSEDADPTSLFEPYVHSGTDATVTGSIGLGLATAQILVSLMGGSIRYGHDRDGTVFEIQLTSVGSEIDPEAHGLMPATVETR